MTPKKPIQEDDDDNAHKDDEAQKVLHFLNSTKDHQFLVDQILKQEQGITFEVFKEEEVPVQEE